MIDDGLAIHVAGLRKTYRVPEREAGLAASMRSLVRRQMREVKAVDDISFWCASPYATSRSANA